MMNRASCLRVAIVGLLFACLPSVAAAQVSKSAAVAKELVQVMEAKKLDSIAAKTGAATGTLPPRCTFRTCSCSSSPATIRRRS